MSVSDVFFATASGIAIFEGVALGTMAGLTAAQAVVDAMEFTGRTESVVLDTGMSMGVVSGFINIIATLQTLPTRQNSVRNVL